MNSPHPLPQNTLRQHLQETPLLSSLHDSLLNMVVATAVWRTVDANATVFWEGEPATGLYYVQYGWLKAVKLSPSGREQVIAFLGAGELFNEIGALSNRPNPATAVALEPCGLWLIPREAMRQLLREHPPFAEQIVASLADRVMHLVDLVADLSLRNVKGRLARLILEDATDNQFIRPTWYTQAELAARLGTVPDVVQRALRSLAADGIIDVERHRIHVRDSAALSRLAEQ